MYRYIDNLKEARKLLPEINSQKFVVIDTETTSLNPREARLIDIQLSTPSDVVILSASCASLLRDITSPFIAQNFNYDWKVLYHHGVNLMDKVVYDTMLIHHLIDENTLESNLEFLADYYLQDSLKYKTEFWIKYKSYEEAPEEERREYAARDIVVTGKVFRVQVKKLASEAVPWSLVEHVMKLAKNLLYTEIHGIKIDLAYLAEIGTKLTSEISQIEPAMRKSVENEIRGIEIGLWEKELAKYKTEKKRATVKCPRFNFSSTKQVGQLLFETLKLPGVKTKKKSWTTKADYLKKIEDQHELIPLILRANKLEKYYGTFIKGILERAVQDRIFPSFKINGTKTGRISHQDPNMGNIPAKDPEWNIIRGIFLPEDNEIIVKSDYSQLEVCIAAHYSQDKNLLKIVLEGASQHDITNDALGLNNRAMAKTLNFALQYQCGPKKVAKIIGCSDKEGQYYWDKYWETYAGQKRVIDECSKKVEDGEPIISIFGRHRRFPKEAKNEFELAAFKRKAYSSLIQGTGGDLTSLAFYSCAEDLRRKKIGRGGWTVHDECIMFALKEHNESVKKHLQSVMLSAGEAVCLTVPLKVECEGELLRWKK